MSASLKSAAPVIEALAARINAQARAENCLCTLPELKGAHVTRMIATQVKGLKPGSGNRVLVPANSYITMPDKIVFEGKGNVLWLGGQAMLDKCDLYFRGDNAAVVVGAHSVLRNLRISVEGEGAFVALGQGVSSRGGRISHAGDGSYVLIGDGCMLAADMTIRTVDGHAIFDRATQKRINMPQPVVVHEHVWLANGVRVSKGARIGAGSVIAQASLVTGQVESNSLYGGQPARKLRDNIAWTRGEAWESVPEKFRS